MSEFKEMKFWIGDDPELSEKVQKLLFDAGYKWFSGRDYPSHTDCHSIYADGDGDITNSDCNKNTFLAKDYVEINIDWMRTKKPETIELNGKTYIKSEAEEAIRCSEELAKALSNLKPVD